MNFSPFPAKNPGTSKAILYLAYSAILCGVFAWLGFPLPHVDDPWYVGTAEHLARTGDLYNPYIKNWMSILTPGKYFAQFPLYPYLLAGWMKLAGIGTVSVLIFFLCNHFLCCLFAGWFVRRARLPDALGIFLPWMILSLSQTQGFRGDIPGLCAFWICAVCITYPSFPSFFAAAVSGCAAILLWPVLLGFLLPLCLVYLVLNWKYLPQSQRPSWSLSRSVALLLGGFTVLLAFLWMIGFEWELFFHDFTQVAAMRRPEGRSIFHAFLGLSWARYNHAFLLSVFLLSLLILYWTVRPGTRLSGMTRLWIFEIFAGCILATILYAVNTQLIYFFFWMVLFAVGAEFLRLRAKAEFGLIIVLSFGLWIQTFYSVKNLLPHPLPATAAAAAALREHPGSVVVFDEISYRYLFDLQPPPGSLAWFCLRPGPDLGASLADKTGDQIWIVAEKRIEPETKGTSNTLVIIP